MKTTEKEVAVYRKVFRAYATDIHKFTQLAKSNEPTLTQRLADNIIVTVSIFSYHDTIYTYLETTDDTLCLDTLLAGCNEYLTDSPGNEGPRVWTELMNIHHWQKPVNLKRWRRTGPVEQKVGMLNKLKPEMVSSYIYYHYLLQESRPGTDNKYTCIYLDENYIFMYVELPKVIESVSYPATLNATTLPQGPAWQELMGKHFSRIPETADPKVNFWHALVPIVSL